MFTNKKKDFDKYSTASMCQKMKKEKKAGNINYIKIERVFGPRFAINKKTRKKFINKIRNPNKNEKRAPHNAYNNISDKY